MALFKRLVDVVKSNVNDLLDKSEDPEKMLPMIIAEMEEQYKSAKSQVAQSIVDQKRIETQYHANVSKGEEWHNRAVMALEQGKEDLAREALAKKKAYEGTAAEFKTQMEEQAKVVERLKVQLSELETRMSEARRKKNVLVARSRRAEAMKKINETMDQASDTGAFDTFSRMEEKVSDKEAYVEAVEELGKDDLAEQFKELEKGSAGSAVDDELAALKAQLQK